MFIVKRDKMDFMDKYISKYFFQKRALPVNHFVHLDLFAPLSFEPTV